MNNYQNIICIHPYDKTTSVLTNIGKLFADKYHVIKPNDEAHEEVIQILKSFTQKSLIVFLGHGTQSGLFGSDDGSYKKKLFINANLSEVFERHDVFLLSCYSADFLKKNKVYDNAIGFGNIISSMEERSAEAEMVTGVYREINEENIVLLNECYLKSTYFCLELLNNEKIYFKELPYYLRYYINKEINNVLLNTNLDNRLEVARLLFEFRDEMELIKN